MSHESYFAELGEQGIHDFNFYNPQHCKTSDLPLLIRYCPDLRTIELPIGMTYDEICLLKQFKNLHTICLEFAETITIESLSVILSLPNLKSLELIHTKIDKNQLQEIAKCQKLTSLDLSGCEYFQDDDLRILSRLKNLEKLSLPSSDLVTDEGINQIKSFSKLKKLDISYLKNLSNISICSVAHLTELEVLNLSRLNIDGEGLCHLKALSNLKVLNLRFCKQMDDQGMGIIGELKNLEQLTVGHCCKISEKGFSFLEECNQLTHLDVSYTRFSEGNLNSIKSLPALVSLSLRACENLNFKAIDKIDDFKSLVDLEFSFCDAVTDDVLKLIAGLPSLETLDIRGCKNVTDIGLEYLSYAPKLSHINLAHCEKISGKGLYSIVKNLTNLKMLKISKGKTISEHDLKVIEVDYPALEIIC